ncbi:MAG: TVP38/TMEM64 family protein, partial [Anaerobacillus sp.]
MKQPKTWFKWIGIIAGVVLLISFSRTYLDFRVEEIRDWILSFGILAPIVYMIIYTIRPLIFFPASVLSIAGGLAFGALFGTIYT